MPGLPHHITQRGVRSTPIFDHDGDRELYLSLMREHAERQGVRFQAWCLMTNHGGGSRVNSRHLTGGVLPVILHGTARPMRVEFSGAVYHCCARGSARQPIFWDDDDRERWLETVGEMHDQFGVLAHAIATMPNHAVIETPRPWAGSRRRTRSGSIGGAALSEKVQSPMGEKDGAEQIRWRARLTTEDMAEQVRSLVADEPGRCVRIWARVCLGGERKVDVAQDFGYHDGSGVIQVVKRPEQSAREDKASARKLGKIRRSVSSVAS